MSFSKCAASLCVLASSFLAADTLETEPLVRSDQPTITETPTPTEEEPSPWFTGPLITPAGHAIPYGHYNIEPYQFVAVVDGIYNGHWKTSSSPNNFYAVTQQTVCQFGLPAGFDIGFAPAWGWNHVHGASHWVLKDLPVGIDYQLYSHKKGGSWFPSLKLNVHWTFPIGKYQKLNPKSLLTNLGGAGTWAPSIGLVTSHLFWCGGHIFFSPRFNVQYTFPTPVHVKGLNAYGGGDGTHGKVFPGQYLNVNFGFELSLSQNWVVATDITYQHMNKTRFKGTRGETDGIPNAGLKIPSSEQFTLAPALEYNWSENWGVIGGVWFTFAGRNTAEFVTGVLAFNVYY